MGAVEAFGFVAVGKPRENDDRVLSLRGFYRFADAGKIRVAVEGVALRIGDLRVFSELVERLYDRVRVDLRASAS